MTYRIYMAGAVDAHADLGRHWRKPLAEAIRARGWEPVWPTSDLRRVDYAGADDAPAAIATAKRLWSLRGDGDGSRGPLDCLAMLATCDGAVFVLDGHEGKGTGAERAVAKWLGLPWYELTVNPKWPAGHGDGVYAYALGQLGAHWRKP
jgi:hypothetical protein